MSREMSDVEISQLLTGYDSDAIDHLGAAVEILRISNVDLQTLKAIVEAVYLNQTRD